MPAQSGRHDIQAYAGRGGITLNHHKFQFSEQMIPLKHLHVVLIYLAVINVVTFFMYGIDKWKAKKSKWRIRETALLGLAVLGGSIGAWLGMKVWHHKTLHKKFKYGVPAIIIVQLALIGYILYRFEI
jgi:uncharacterized membrane protein YsdA (DUF1294 family)